MATAHMTIPSKILDAVFGAESTGDTPEDRARTSRRRFVRSQHQLTEYHPDATGRIFDATEALRLFGWPVLAELADRPASPILRDSKQPYQVIERKLAELGVSLRQAARKQGWTDESIQRFQQKKQVPFRNLEKLARGLDLENEDQLGIKVDNTGDHQVAARLRTLRSSDPQRFSENTVLDLAESAWTIRKQIELASMIGAAERDAVTRLGFVPSDDYGGHPTPTYLLGYRLAEEARQRLGLGAEAPIASMKELVEAKLGIPVVQLDLFNDLAGATVASRERRGIVVNLQGENSDPLVRRMTVAHELGHFLWDPDSRLERVKVDRYTDLTRNVMRGGRHIHPVERRANAFAIEFLAPGDAIRKVFEQAGRGANGLAAVVRTYGISRTAATMHLQNVIRQNIGVDQEPLDMTELSGEWEGSESLAVPLFSPKSVPVSRRGRFAGYVVQALDKALISRDTAASLFGCDPTELDIAVQSTRNYVLG
jgi:Zn-dependent peptidase ImmA (M78 family)